MEGNFMENRSLISMKNSLLSWELDRCLSNSVLALIIHQGKSWHLDVKHLPTTKCHSSTHPHFLSFILCKAASVIYWFNFHLPNAAWVRPCLLQGWGCVWREASSVWGERGDCWSHDPWLTGVYWASKDKLSNSVKFFYSVPHFVSPSHSPLKCLPLWTKAQNDSLFTQIKCQLLWETLHWRRNDLSAHFGNSFLCSPQHLCPFVNSL